MNENLMRLNDDQWRISLLPRRVGNRPSVVEDTERHAGAGAVPKHKDVLVKGEVLMNENLMRLNDDQWRMSLLPRRVGNRPSVFAAALLLVLAAGLSACSSQDNPPASSALPAPMSLEELGCTEVAGLLDPLQTQLTSVTQPLANDLGALLATVLDLVDATVAGAQSLATASAGGDVALLTPVLDQALCTTAAVGLVLESLADTTPLDDQAELNRLLGLVVSLQEHLTAATLQLAETGALPGVGTLLADVTYTLAGVLEGTVGLSRLPQDSPLVAVLGPVDGLLIDLNAAFESLATDDTRAFADDLLGSVTHLVDGLAASLGPLGLALDPVVLLLDSVLSQLAGVLSQLLGVL